MKALRTLALLSLLVSCSVQAETKTFIRDYTFIAGEADSKLTARAYALEQVKRILLEEVGVYLRSTFETTDSERRSGGENAFESLTKQQTMAITAGITETRVLDETWDGTRYHIWAEIVLDPQDVMKKVQDVMNKEESLAAMEESRRRADEALAEATRLREELRKTKGEVDRLKLGNSLEKQTRALTTADWFEKGQNAGEKGLYEDAVSYYSKVIGLDSNYAEAYNNRGVAEFQLKDYPAAVADYNRAIRLKSDFAQVYYNRGLVRSELRDYTGATADFDRAIDLKKGYVLAYYNRGLAKSNKHDYNGAISDQSKVIELDKDNVQAYYSRGTARYEASDYKGALADLDRAIALRPDAGNFYLARGMTHQAAGDLPSAIADFRAAQTLGCRVPEEWLKTKK